MSNLLKHAEIELEAIGALSEKDDFYGGMTGKSVMELMRVFSEQGHSGMSANIVRNLFNKLADYKPLSSITCKDDEWGDVSEHQSGDVYQNKRLSSVFKDGKNGIPHYISAIVFTGQNGSSFTSGSVELKSGGTVGSSQNIKLPFTPKTFYIDVIETEWADKDEKVKKQGGGWWTSYVKDENQLKEVFKYYNKK